MFQPQKVSTASTQKTGTWSLSELSGGLNLADLEYKLLDNQSPDCLNVWFNNRILCKRFGTKNINTAALPAEILAMYPFLFSGKIVFAADTHLYTLAPNEVTPTVIYSGLTANHGCFFRYNQNLWYINGAQYVRWDGATATDVRSFAYTPTVVLNRTPTGGGDMFDGKNGVDDYNRLQPGFKNNFNGDGSSKAYTLTDQNLDGTTVTCTVGGVTKTENTDFTVNRTTGVVTFTTVPASGQNNVIITAYKTRSDWINPVLTCKKAISFTGSNGNRIFFGANGTSNYYYSSAADPSYFPVTNVNLINSNDGEITGFGLQNDTLVIFKTSSIYGVTYSYDTSSASAYYPCNNINSEIGCDCPATICLINNRLCWLNSNLGVFTLVNQLNTSGSATVYRNANPISRNINGNARASGLMQEDNLTKAVGIDFMGKYWIAVNGKVYLWDYELTPYQNLADTDKAQLMLSWWLFDGLPITCFCKDGTDLYCGDTLGFVRHFENSYSDNGTAIPAHWKMKINHLGVPNMLKTVKKIWLACRTDTATTLQITYYTDNSPGGIADPSPLYISSFNWAEFDWSAFSWGVYNWFKEWRKVPPIKNAQAFSVMVSNENANEDLNVSDIIVQFRIIKEVRRSV